MKVFQSSIKKLLAAGAAVCFGIALAFFARGDSARIRHARERTLVLEPSEQTGKLNCLDGNGQSGFFPPLEDREDTFFTRLEALLLGHGRVRVDEVDAVVYHHTGVQTGTSRGVVPPSVAEAVLDQDGYNEFWNNPLGPMSNRGEQSIAPDGKESASGYTSKSGSSDENGLNSNGNEIDQVGLGDGASNGNGLKEDERKIPSVGGPSPSEGVMPTWNDQVGLAKTEPEDAESPAQTAQAAQATEKENLTQAVPASGDSSDSSVSSEQIAGQVADQSVEVARAPENPDQNTGQDTGELTEQTTNVSRLDSAAEQTTDQDQDIGQPAGQPADPAADVVVSDSENESSRTSATETGSATTADLANNSSSTDVTEPELDTLVDEPNRSVSGSAGVATVTENDSGGTPASFTFPQNVDSEGGAIRSAGLRVESSYLESDHAVPVANGDSLSQSQIPPAESPGALVVQDSTGTTGMNSPYSSSPLGTLVPVSPSDSDYVSEQPAGGQTHSAGYPPQTVTSQTVIPQTIDPPKPLVTYRFDSDETLDSVIQRLNIPEQQQSFFRSLNQTKVRSDGVIPAGTHISVPGRDIPELATGG